MKTIRPLLSISLLYYLLFTPLKAQECEPASAISQLNTNNVTARLDLGGRLWNFDSQPEGGYVVEQADGNGPIAFNIFSGGLWFGGINESNDLKLSAQTYGPNGFWPGPLSESGETDAETCSNYDQFWETNSTDINSHRNDFEDNGTIDGTIPPSVLAWPGRGNPNFLDIFGFVLPDNASDMAPFVDVDSDGIYNPQNGDYPDINDADQGVWWVFNNDGNTTLFDPFPIEVQVLAYAYQSSDLAINNATFYNYRLINRHVETLDSAFIGIWTDPDLSCDFTEYMGTIPDKDLLYWYYKDGCLCDGTDMYCEEVPILGIQVLQGVLSPKNFDPEYGLVNTPIGEAFDTLVDAGMTYGMYYQNSGVNPPPPPGTGDPGSVQEYYNYLSGSWRDGTRMTYGGTGYNPSGDFANHAFSDFPNDPNGWSMCTEDAPNMDLRTLVSSGPFRIAPGQVQEFSFAMTYTPAVSHPCPDLSPVCATTETIEALFRQVITTTETLVRPNTNIQFLPNPMSDKAELFFPDLNQQVIYVQIYTIDGRLVADYRQVDGDRLQIERGNWNPGLYIYKLVSKDFKVYSNKFIVQ